MDLELKLAAAEVLASGSDYTRWLGTYAHHLAGKRTRPRQELVAMLEVGGGVGHSCPLGACKAHTGFKGYHTVGVTIMIIACGLTSVAASGYGVYVLWRPSAVQQ